MPTLRKLTSNINLFQLKGQNLALSNDMHVFLQMTSIRSAILITARGVLRNRDVAHALHYTN